MAGRHPKHGDDQKHARIGGKRDESAASGSDKNIGQTNMPNEQDPERRLGSYTGAGEAQIKQPTQGRGGRPD